MAWLVFFQNWLCDEDFSYWLSRSRTRLNQKNKQKQSLKT